MILHTYVSTHFEHLWEFRNCRTCRVRCQINGRFSDCSSECRQSYFLQLLVFTIKDKSVNESSKNFTVQYNLTSSWHHMPVSYHLYTLSLFTPLYQECLPVHRLQQADIHHTEICVSDLNTGKKPESMKVGVWLPCLVLNCFSGLSSLIQCFIDYLQT